jgi:peptidoglycan/LPS O-acetylase OafA/YrhL
MNLVSGSIPSLNLLVKVSGSFPIIIMSSFFVLAISFERKPERSFRQFFTKRFQRIWVPFFIWTMLYLLFGEILIPIAKGARAISWPSATLLVSGYRHLWFLQFIFVGSILAAPLFSHFARRRSSRRLFAVLCFVAALLYELALKQFLLRNFVPAWPSRGDMNWLIFTMQTVDFLVYAPAGIGIALLADEINALHKRRAFRVITILFASAALLVHLMSAPNPFTRVIYSLALFIALLRPLRRLSLKSVRFIAKYTYAIYILHLGVVGIVAWVLYVAHVELNTKVILVSSMFAFVLSLFVAVLLRSLFPWDWFLPLIPVSGEKPRTAGPVREPDAATPNYLLEEVGR